MTYCTVTLNQRVTLNFLHDINAAREEVRVSTYWQVMWCVCETLPGVMACDGTSRAGPRSSDERWCVRWQLVTRWIWRNPVCWWELPAGGVWPWSSCTPCTPQASAPGPPSGHFYSGEEGDKEVNKSSKWHTLTFPDPSSYEQPEPQ